MNSVSHFENLACPRRATLCVSCHRNIPNSTRFMINPTTPTNISKGLSVDSFTSPRPSPSLLRHIQLT